jgi:hypothetical protein
LTGVNKPPCCSGDRRQRPSQAAGDLDVRLGGGPATINQFLAAGLVNHPHVVQVPIVLDRGAQLWDNPHGLHERYFIEAVTIPAAPPTCSSPASNWFRRPCQPPSAAGNEASGRACANSVHN